MLDYAGVHNDVHIHTGTSICLSILHIQISFLLHILEIYYNIPLPISSIKWDITPVHPLNSQWDITTMPHPWHRLYIRTFWQLAKVKVVDGPRDWRDTDIAEASRCRGTNDEVVGCGKLI